MVGRFLALLSGVGVCCVCCGLFDFFCVFLYRVAVLRVLLFCLLG